MYLRYTSDYRHPVHQSHKVMMHHPSLHPSFHLHVFLHPGRFIIRPSAINEFNHKFVTHRIRNGFSHSFIEHKGIHLRSCRCIFV